MSDPPDEEAPCGPAGPSSAITLEAVNYDAVPYVLYLRADTAGRGRRKLYLPPLPASPPGSSVTSFRRLRLMPAAAYSLVLEAPDGRRLDVRPVDAAEGVSKRSFSVVGATLLASQG